MPADGEAEFKGPPAQVAWLSLASERELLDGLLKAHSWTSTGGPAGPPQRHRHTHKAVSQDQQNP